MSEARGRRIRGVLALLAYLAGAAFLAALVAVAVVRMMPYVPENVARAILRKGPDKVMARCLQGWLVLLLPWLLKQLDWRGWGDLGFTPDRPASCESSGIVQLGRGLAFGLVTLGGVALAMYMAGARIPAPGGLARLSFLTLASYALAALAVGFFEEILARGILFRVPARIWGAMPAALVGSALFALAHFVETDPAAFNPASYGGAVVAVLKSTFLRIEGGPAFPLRALNLTLLGLVLCAFVARKRTIWFAIGAHSGWVYCIKLNSALTVRAETGVGGWWGGMRADGTDSPWTLLLMALFLAAAVWWPRRGREASVTGGGVSPTLWGNAPLTWTPMSQRSWSHEPAWDRWAWGLLLATAFSLPFSIALGQACGGLCLIVLLPAALRRRVRLKIPSVFWPALAFAAIAVLSVVFGPEPFRVVKKTGRLVWFLFIPVTATLASIPARRTALLTAFILGSGTLGLKILLVNSWRAWQAPTPILAALDGYFPRMVELGSMTAGQMLMIGLLATVALLLWRGRERIAAGWWALAAIQLAGLILNFKRGSWITAVGLGAVGLAARRRWLWLAGLLALVGIALCSQPVRERVEDLREEWDLNGGGRLTMWVRIAPALVRQHPLGVGYRSVSADMLRRIEPKVERRRNHLHSNPVQVLVETGWIGLSVYLFWMGLAVRDAAHRLRGAPESGEVRAQTVAFAWMLAGLLLNGLVEYNFGDTELMMALAMVMGALGGAAEARRL